MFKITKYETCVVCLQFALMATSRLKPAKVLEVIFAWINSYTRSAFLCLLSRISTLSAYCIENGHILTS